MHVNKCFPYLIHLVYLKIVIHQRISVFLIQLNLFCIYKSPLLHKVMIGELPLNALGTEAPTYKDDGFIFLANCLLCDCWSA